MLKSLLVIVLVYMLVVDKWHYGDVMHCGKGAVLRFYISANSIFCNIPEWYIGLYNLIIKHVNCGVTSFI